MGKLLFWGMAGAPAALALYFAVQVYQAISAILAGLPK